MEREVVLVNLDELAARWQIPVGRIKYLITDCCMPMDQRQVEWFATHSDLILIEKQHAFEKRLFPEQFRSISQILAKTSETDPTNNP